MKLWLVEDGCSDNTSSMEIYVVSATTKEHALEVLGWKSRVSPDRIVELAPGAYPQKLWSLKMNVEVGVVIERKV